MWITQFSFSDVLLRYNTKVLLIQVATINAKIKKSLFAKCGFHVTTIESNKRVIDDAECPSSGFSMSDKEFKVILGYITSSRPS